MFGEIGLDKLVLLLVMFLLLFGAKRIPEIARSMGKGIREFKSSMAGLDASLEEPVSNDRSVLRDSGASSYASGVADGESVSVRRLNG
jgi:sec-independent protein translocase protein TatA